MDAPLRNAYLDALGIDRWVARDAPEPAPASRPEMPPARPVAASGGADAPAAIAATSAAPRVAARPQAPDARHAQRGPHRIDFIDYASSE
jgi:hypothetical protein